MRLFAFAGLVFVVACGIGCAAGSSSPPSASEPVPPPPARSESAAPVSGAECGDRTCGPNELCVPQGFCSGVRPPTTPEERAVVYTCVPVTPECAENPSCGCVPNPCRWGSCAYISRGVVQCICA